jgi:hypothetical protein
MGSNQKIAIGLIGSTVLLTFGLVLLGKVTGQEWLSFSQVFVLAALSITLGISGGLKLTQVIKGSPKQDEIERNQL